MLILLSSKFTVFISMNKFPFSSEYKALVEKLCETRKNGTGKPPAQVLFLYLKTKCDTLALWHGIPSFSAAPLRFPFPGTLLLYTAAYLEERRISMNQLVLEARNEIRTLSGNVAEGQHIVTGDIRRLAARLYRGISL